MKKQPAKGHTAKHSQTKKHSQHHKTKKHHPQHQHQQPTHHHHQKVHTAAKGAKNAKPRGLALAEEVACCTAEALAASLRLTGRPVSAQDVLTLYRHTADGPDVFTSIPATLEAAYRWGLAGVRPVAFDYARLFPGDDVGEAIADVGADLHVLGAGPEPVPSVDGVERYAFPFAEFGGTQVPVVSAHGSSTVSHRRSSLILGVDLPGPHAVCAAGGWWFSWGDHYPPSAWPDALVEEAWAITWP